MTAPVAPSSAPETSICRGLTAEQYEQLLKPISPKRVLQANGHSHVAQQDVRAHLNRVFGFEVWDFEIIDLRLLRDEMVPGKNGGERPAVSYLCRGRLTIRDLNGTVIKIAEDAATGSSPNLPSYGDAHDFAVKNAVSYALKRCAVNLGDQFGLSLYNRGQTAPLVIASLADPRRRITPAEDRKADMQADVPQQVDLGEERPEGAEYDRDTVQAPVAAGHGPAAPPNTPAAAPVAPTPAASPAAAASAPKTNALAGNRCSYEGCKNVLTPGQMSTSMHKFRQPICLLHQRDPQFTTKPAAVSSGDAAENASSPAGTSDADPDEIRREQDMRHELSTIKQQMYNRMIALGIRSKVEVSFGKWDNAAATLVVAALLGTPDPNPYTLADKVARFSAATMCVEERAVELHWLTDDDKNAPLFGPDK